MNFKSIYSAFPFEMIFVSDSFSLVSVAKNWIMFHFNLNFEQIGMGFMVTLWMWHDDLFQWHLKYIPLTSKRAWPTLSRGPKLTSYRKHLDYKMSILSVLIDIV